MHTHIQTLQYNAISVFSKILMTLFTEQVLPDYGMSKRTYVNPISTAVSLPPPPKKKKNHYWGFLDASNRYLESEIQRTFHSATTHSFIY